MTNDKPHYVTGYVSRSPDSPGESWQVRVKDSASKHDGEKMSVASTCDQRTSWLAQGLNVKFVIGFRDGTKLGEKIPCAIDVQLAD